MTFDLDLNADGRYLRSTFAGTFDFDQAIGRFAQSLAACVLSRVDAMLVDYRQLRGEMLATHRILYAMAALERYREHLRCGGGAVRFAYLAGVSHVGEYRPGMSVLEHTDMHVVLTTELDDAERWLLVD